tara:strand:- start:6967 stop:7905 length:939 start_codon:yes stop_codon:yes gene_type:complete
MGTLLNFLPDDDAELEASFKLSTQDTLENGIPEIAGIPIGPELPMAEYAGAQASAIKDAEDMGIFSKAYAQTIKAIDKALPPGILSPPIFDPTIVIDIDPFFEFLISVGIENPLEWFTENYPQVLEIDPIAITDMTQCKNQKFAEEMNKIDSSINVDEAKEAAEKICGFPMPSFAPPVFDFEMPDFGLPDLLPIEMFAFPNFQIPQINWAINFTLLELIEIIKALLTKIEDLILAIIQGVVALIKFIVEFIIQSLFALILPLLGPLGEAILFMANLVTFLFKVIAAFIVALVGHIIGDGLVTVLVASMLGLA